MGKGGDGIGQRGEVLESLSDAGEDFLVAENEVEAPGGSVEVVEQAASRLHYVGQVWPDDAFHTDSVREPTDIGIARCGDDLDEALLYEARGADLERVVIVEFVLLID